MSRLVIVEGFPGSGKSTTAQWAAIQWRRGGRACRWLYEQEPDHPLVGQPAGVEYRTWDDYYEVHTGRWAAFVAAAGQADDVTIVESALLQYQVFAMLRNGAEPEAIVAFIRRLGAVIQPLAPRLVYFRAPDPDAAYRDISARRGERALQGVLRYYEGSDFARQRGLYGFDGMLAYWREHAAVCERAVAALRLATLIVDAREGDWTWRRARIARFLDLPPGSEAQPPAAELARYVGRYRVAWTGRAGAVPRPPIESAHDCTVALEDHRLVVDNLLWPRNSLLWKEGNVFHAEAWPIELTFEQAADGAVGSLTVHA